MFATFILQILLWTNFHLLSSINASPPKCGGGQACIFVGKDIGWVAYEEKKNQIPKYPPVSDSWNRSTTTLFVTMASFRDKLCPRTLFNLFSKAKYPYRITVGVVQQNLDVDVDCLLEYCKMMIDSKSKYITDETCPFVDQIRMLRVSANDAKGPTWGRALGAKLLKDEEFCMQTDSHMDYVPNWDILMMEMWSLTRNEYGILSTYVTDMHELGSHISTRTQPAKGVNGLHEVPHLYVCLCICM